MEALLQFFEQMSTWHRLAWVVACLGFSWVLEGLYPLVGLAYRKWRHAGVNGVFLATSLAINVLFGAATLGVAQWTASHELGLLFLIEWPLWVELIAAVVVLDFTAQYLAHFLLHHVRPLWRFHVIHHSDTKVDATTGARLHPGDYAFREMFALGGMALAGAPLAFYLAYRLLTIFFTFVTHANVAPPRWLDAPLALLFVTPNLHKFHHHHERPWTDRNFGGILSIWDRLFGTLVYGDPRRVEYGVDVTDPKRDEDVLHQFVLPFDRRERLERSSDRGPERGGPG